MDNDTLKPYLDHLSFRLISPDLFPNGPFSELFIKKRMLLKCVDMSTFNPKDALRKMPQPNLSSTQTSTIIVRIQPIYSWYLKTQGFDWQT